jgi:hypothetical protein
LNLGYLIKITRFLKKIVVEMKTNKPHMNTRVVNEKTFTSAMFDINTTIVH